MPNQFMSSPNGASGSVIDANVLTSGEEVIPRAWANAGPGFASGSLRLSYFTARKTEAITQLRAETFSTAAATVTLARMGIYTVAENGDLTLAAATANDTTLFGATFTKYTRSVTATLNKVAGQRYAFGVLVVATTPPLIMGTSVPAALSADAPRIAGQLTGQTDLPASIAAGSVGNSGLLHCGVLLP